MNRFDEICKNCGKSRGEHYSEYCDSRLTLRISDIFIPTRKHITRTTHTASCVKENFHLFFTASSESPNNTTTKPVPQKKELTMDDLRRECFPFDLYGKKEHALFLEEQKKGKVAEGIASKFLMLDKLEAIMKRLSSPEKEKE